MDGRDKPGHDRVVGAPFPWKDAMRFGLGVLRLSSHDFWSMTPRELACAIEALTGRTGTPFARATFDDLMKRFPDG